MIITNSLINTNEANPSSPPSPPPPPQLQTLKNQTLSHPISIITTTMDRLIKPVDADTVELHFIRDQKCTQTFKLTNLMHTMSVAVSLTSSDPSLFSFDQPFSIIPPLSTSSFSLLLNKPSHDPPLSTPPNTVLVRSSMLPTGKAHHDDLRRLFSRPGPHIFKDATLPISLVGPHVAESLLSPSKPKSSDLETNFLFAKAISTCDEAHLTSLLRIAAQSGKSNFVRALIEAGGDINGRDSRGESIMSLAVKSGSLDLVRILIESGFLIDNEIERLLHEAAAMNRADLMEILCLVHTDIDLNSVNSLGQTALHIAASHGHVEALQFLVSIKSDVDTTDHHGWTPLHCAAQEGHFQAVEHLLNNSVFSKYAVTREGKTAFGLAVENGYSCLYDSLYLQDSLHRAARIDDVHTMKSCLDRGAKINGRDQNGWTPLHRAAFKGHLESVKLLVGRGARANDVDGSGYTPLIRAVEMGHVKVAMYLVSCGAKASLKGLKGMMVDSDMECVKKHFSRLDLKN